MRLIRRAVGFMILTIACLALTACAFSPFDLVATSQPASSGGGASQTATQAPAASTNSGAAAAAAPKVIRVKFAPSPAPAPADPLLANGSWGYHSKPEAETEEDTSVLHQDLEDAEYSNLAEQQRTRLLCIFRNSSKVHRLIEDNGGEPCNTTYSIHQVSANDDAGINTPWVTATLQADFQTEDGLRRVECQVYRQKTAKGLDNRPFVSSTVVGWVAADGTISDPVQKRRL